MQFRIHARALLSAALAIALASPAYAGDIIISEIDRRSGALKEIASGRLQHAPAHLFKVGSEPFRLADACGAVHEVKNDAYGEKTLAGPVHGDRSLAGIHLLSLDRRGGTGIGIGHDGKPHLLKVSDNGRGFAEKTDFQKGHEFAVGIDTELDFSKTRLFVGAEHGIPDLAFLDDGRLLGVYDLRSGDAKGRFIAPKNGWSNVVAAVPMQAGSGRERRAVLVTVDRGGQMVLHTPVEESGDGSWGSFVTSMDSKPVAGKYAGTTALFAGDNDTAYRVTSGGDLFAVDVLKGTEQRLGIAGAFKGLLAKADDNLYLVSQTGGFAACPKNAAPVIAETPKKDTGIVAAADEIKALSDAHYKTIDEAAREELPSFSGEFGAAEPQIKQLYAKIENFEKTVIKPVRDKLNAFAAKYGDKDAVETTLREATGQLWYMNDRDSWLQDALKRWDEVRPAIADSLASQASTGFLLCEHATDRAQRSAHCLSAKPWAEWALRFKPDHAEAKEMLAKADGEAASADTALKNAIQNAVWPKDVAVDGDIVALKKKMLAYFQKRDSGEYFDKGARYFAIRIDHDWYISKTDVLDRPTEWRASAWVASTVPGDPKHARVRRMEVGTQSGDRNSPLVNQYGSSDSYLIPIARVPADDKTMLQESLKLIGK